MYAQYLTSGVRYFAEFERAGTDQIEVLEIDWKTYNRFRDSETACLVDGRIVDCEYNGIRVVR